MRYVIQVHVKNSSVVKGRRYEGLNALCSPQDLLDFYSKRLDNVEIVINDVVATLLGRNGCFGLLDLLKKSSTFPVTYQGGIQTFEDIDNALEAGADRVALNSIIYTDTKFCCEAVKKYGSSTMVASIDYYKTPKNNTYSLKSVYGREAESVSLTDHVNKILDLGFSEIFLGSIYRDGMGVGYDLQAMDYFSDSKVPILLSGGCSNLHHIAAAKNYQNQPSGIVLSSLPHYLALERLPMPPDGNQMIRALQKLDSSQTTFDDFANLVSTVS